MDIGLGIRSLGVISPGNYSDEMALDKLETKMRNWREAFYVEGVSLKFIENGRANCMRYRNIV